MVPIPSPRKFGARKEVLVDQAMTTHRSNAFELYDSHFHIIDPGFPLVANQGFLPEPYTCDDYLQRMKNHRLAGGAIVSGSFQAFDQSYLLDALARLGPAFAGVTQLPASVHDDELMALDQAGVRALRFNLKRGGSEETTQLDAMARRVHELVGWHVELYVDSRELGSLYDTLIALPAVSIDHLGLSKEGFATLLKLAERGVHIKATGFGRVDFDTPRALREIYSANPDVLMFGTDLPSTRAPRPYSDEDITMVIEALGEQAAEKVLSKNAIAWYARVR
jgi:predicted TIM-barrel fold metal-dependent hydrolase